MFKKISLFVRFLAKKLWAGSSVTICTSILLWWFYGSFVAFIVFSIGVSSMFYNAQDFLLYYPNEPPNSRIFVLQPSSFRLPYESVKISTKDGVLIHLFFIKQPNTGKNPPTVLFFHGNAGNMGQRLSNVQGLYEHLHVNIVLMEYRGYGLSEGTPSEQGMYCDAQSTLEYLLHRNDIDHSKIILFGRSLGGAIAIDLASRVNYRGKIWALIVENTFTSIPEMAKVILQWKFLKCLPMIAHKNKYKSLEKIGHIMIPTLIISGTNDILVPPSMSEALHSRCAAQNKQLVHIKGGGHDTTWTRPEYYPTLKHFIDNIPPMTTLSPYYDEFKIGQTNNHCIIMEEV